MADFRSSPHRPPKIERLEGRAFLSASVTPLPATGLVQPAVTAAVSGPHVRGVNPANGSSGVLRDVFVSCEVELPTGGIDTTTLTSQTVFLFRKTDGKRIPATINTSGAGDVIVLKPLQLLDPNIQYVFQVTDGLKDLSGASFTPFVSKFTAGYGTERTDPRVQFDRQLLPETFGRQYLSLTMGPDGKLYAGTTAGQIFRYTLNPDGTLGASETINSIVKLDGYKQSFITGLAFDPASTAEKPILWVTRAAAAWTNAPDFSGKITVLSGSALTTAVDKVVNLPRAVRDHVTDQLSFGPDGAIYFCQASSTAMGAPDGAWGERPEHLLTAAILRLDPKKLGSGALDVKTPDAGGSYNPYASNAPLTIYATGVRNAYDLLWHSNGMLYAPTNGSAAGGNVPAGPFSPAITDVSQPETDYLFRIFKGGYYGHPNPTRNEFVLNGGNPTAGRDPYEVSDYPVGTLPDSHWQAATFDMGLHQSPNGVIEYSGTAFDGALDHKILVVRYSGGGDIVALTVNPDGTIKEELTGMKGMTGFSNPLDLIENKKTGDIYVSEFGTQRITLLRAPGERSGIGSSTGSGQTPTPTPTPNPTPTPTPTPTPAPTGPAPIPDASRPRKLRIVIKKIHRFAQKYDLPDPDTTRIDASELKNTLAGLKDLYRREVLVGKIQAMAGKKNYSLPNLDSSSFNQLLDLRKLIKKAKMAK